MTGLLFSASPSSYWKPGWLVVFKWRDSDAFWNSHFGTEYPFIHCHWTFWGLGTCTEMRNLYCARSAQHREQEGDSSSLVPGPSETSFSAEITQQLYQRKQPWLCYSRFRIWLLLQFVSSLSIFLWCFLLNSARTHELLAAVLHGQASKLQLQAESVAQIRQAPATVGEVATEKAWLLDALYLHCPCLLHCVYLLWIPSTGEGGASPKKQFIDGLASSNK